MPANKQQKKMQKLQEAFHFYILKKNALSLDQSQSYEQVGKKRGFLTSLWPIFSFSNILKNYSERKGILYFLFHPTTEYKPGRSVLFPSAQVYYGALYKRLTSKLYTTEEMDIRQKNITHSETLIREIEYASHADPQNANLRLCREMIDQMHMKEIRGEKDSYYKLLQKKISSMGTATINKAMNGRALHLDSYRAYLLEKEKYFNTLAEITISDDFLPNKDYSYAAFAKFKEEHPHKDYKSLLKDFIQNQNEENDELSPHTFGPSATQMLRDYTLFPKASYLSFSCPPGNPKQTPEAWAEEIYLNVIHQAQRSKIALFKDFPPEYMDYYRVLQEKIAFNIPDEQERPCIVLKIKGYDLGYERTTNVGLAGGTGPLSDAQIIEKIVLERAECPKDQHHIQDSDREHIRESLKNFSGVLYSMPPPRDASHAAKDAVRYLQLYSSVRETIPCRSLHILTNTGHLNKQVFDSSLIFGAAALGAVDDMTKKIADLIKRNIEDHQNKSGDAKKGSVLVLGTIKADQELLYGKLFTERGVPFAYPRGQFKAGIEDKVFLQEIIDQAKRNRINEPMPGLELSCGEALIDFIVKKVQETGTTSLLFGCTEIPMILNAHLPNNSEQTYQQLLNEQLKKLPGTHFYYDSEELFTTIIKERSKELEKARFSSNLPTEQMSEGTLEEKKLKLTELHSLIVSSLTKFNQLTDEKSIHKRNVVFAIKQFLKDSSEDQLQAAKLANPRWDESANPFGSRVKALVEMTERLHKEIKSASLLKSSAVHILNADDEDEDSLSLGSEVEQEERVDDAEIIRPKTIERIVCSGGGAKGVVYPGSYKAMLDTGVYEGAKEFSGASAGAITAALMAVGMPSQDFREQLLTTNFDKLMGNTVQETGPGISSVCGKMLTKTGAPLLKFIRENINSSVKESLKNVGTFSKDALQDEQLLALIGKIQERPENELRITFGDLALLNKYFPEQFKQLTIPAVRYPNGELQIFNGALTPDVEIALACRASASLPVILQPQAITINGEEQLFVDGGLYDNLPTDYFDSEAGQFVKNKKPEQTLVFAFGEGLKNDKNQVFQALYGHRLDETIADELIEAIIDSSIKQIQTKPKNAKEELTLFKVAINSVLDKHIENKYFTVKEAAFIKNIAGKTIEKLLLNPKVHQQFWLEYKREAHQGKRMILLSALIKEQMKPALYDAGTVERLKRDVLVKKLGGLDTPYTNTAQKELGYQKLRSEYALRTVELRVGTIKTTDFVPTHLARVMDALGYLDTVNHITNHDLHNPKKFNGEQFFVDLIKNFESIYQAVLVGSGKDPATDNLLLEINSLRFQLQLQGKSEELINRQIYQLIKDRVEHGLDSAEAFALSRAVEYANKTLNSEALFKETYEEGFKRSGVFSASNITGEYIIRASSLHAALAEKSVNMFDLYNKRSSENESSRTEQVFDALSEMDTFTEEYKQHQEKQEQLEVVIEAVANN